ncbi:MAG: efflux RND transporter periplasmic adaptor subunit [Gammaproteobacteria bacterium]
MPFFRATAVSFGLMALMHTGAALAEGVSVTAQPLSELTVDDRQSAPGEVVAANQTQVASQLGARIERVLVDAGMSVAKGDVLVELEVRDFELAVAQSQANIASLGSQIEQAEAQLRRAESLIEKNFMSREDVQTRATALAVLQGSLRVEKVARDIATTNLSRTKIVAPFAGEVVERQAQRGGYVRQGDVLLTLTQTSGREIAAPVFPGAVAALGAASPVFTSYGRDYALTVARISSVIDATTQLQNVRFEFVGDAAPVGASGTVSWRTATGLIPARLIERRNRSLGVFVAREGRAVFEVLPDASEGRTAAHALAPDALLIVDGRTRLQDGDPIVLRAP